tara:strand:- start:82 stop:438 length:357 start_codon:yes stop_codon:yes gene_type:complete
MTFNLLPDFEIDILNNNNNFQNIIKEEKPINSFKSNSFELKKNNEMNNENNNEVNTGINNKIKTLKLFNNRFKSPRTYVDYVNYRNKNNIAARKTRLKNKMIKWLQEAADYNTKIKSN